MDRDKKVGFDSFCFVHSAFDCDENVGRTGKNHLYVVELGGDFLSKELGDGKVDVFFFGCFAEGSAVFSAVACIDDYDKFFCSGMDGANEEHDG